MFEVDNIYRDNHPDDNRISLDSYTKRDEFLEWLSVGNAKRHSPSVCIACIDKISEYAIRKKISIVSIWDITQYSVFQPVYKRLLDEKLLRITENSTYKIFNVAGQLYLKFLKEKPWTRRTTAIQDVAEVGIEKRKDELLKPIKPDDVIAWVVTQPNTNGTLYIENVARSYISCLRSAPQKLALTIENRDVFSCHTVIELDALWNVFKSASNYKTVNSVTSGSLSAGLAVYRRYLAHLSNLKENINSGNLVTFPQPNIRCEATCSFADTVMDDEYLYGLRDEFRNYIRQQHPEWADSTVDMHKSDAYFLKNNDVGISLTEALANEEALLVARDKIRDYLRDVNKVGNPENGANGYLRTVRMFKEFLSRDPAPVTTLTKDNYDIAVIEKVVDIISMRFANGFRLNSSIELSRFRNFYANELGEELKLTDEELKSYIAACGTTFDGKVYAVSAQAKERIKELAEEYFTDGAQAIFFAEFYSKNENWLFSASVVSEDMLISILRRLFPKLLFTQTYFGYTDASVFATLENEILRVWGDDVLLTYEQLSERLQYMPLDRIKYALCQNGDFIWNSVETFSHISRIDITESERESIREAVVRECNVLGYVSITDLPFVEIEERNYELSITGVHNAVYRICLSDKFDKKGKIVTRKGDVFDAMTIMKEYCRTIEKCSLDDLLNFEKELTGEVHRWIPMEAGNTILVRVDRDTYVADRYVHFNGDVIDIAIGLFVKGDYLPLKSFTTFGAFPDCGQVWNLFLLESYCRRFSRMFRVDTPSVNSRNAGVVIRKSCGMDYTEIMTDAVANADIPLNNTAIGKFLYENGYTGKRTTSKTNEIIDKAKALRERRG